MANDNSNKRRLYDALSKEYDMGTFEQFSNDIQDDAKRKKLYDVISKEYDLPDYNGFTGQLGIGIVEQPESSPTFTMAELQGMEGESNNEQSTDTFQSFQPSAGEIAKFHAQRKRMENTLQQQHDAFSERYRNMQEYNTHVAGGQMVESGVQYNPKSKKVEKTYITPTGDKTADKTAADIESLQYRQSTDMTVGGQLRKAENRLTLLKEKAEARRAEVAKEWEESQSKASGLNKFFTGLKEQHSGLSNADALIDADDEYNALRAAIHQTEEQIGTLERQYDRGKGKDVGFWRGFGDVAGNPRTWDFGMGDLRDAVTMVRASGDRSDKTDNVKAAEQEMLQSAYDNEQTQAQYGGNDDFWYRAGTMTGHIPAFMVDFAATGGGFGAIKGATKGAAKLAAKAVGKEVTERIAKDGLITFVKENGVKGLGQYATNWTIKALGATADDLLIRAPLMANTVQVGKTASDIIDRKLGNVVVNEDGTYDFSNDKTWGSAIWQGEANAIIENYSEMFGAHLDPVVTFGNMSKLADVVGAKRLGAVLSKSDAGALTGIMGQTHQLFNKMGVSDYFGEVTEEYYGQLWRTMLNLDDAYQQNPDGTRTNLFVTGQFNCDIWGGMALSMGLMGAGKHTLSGVQYMSLRHKVNKADAHATELLGKDVWEQMRATIDLTTNDDMGSVAMGVINDENLTLDGKAAVLSYMERSMNMRGFNLGTLAQKRGGVHDTNRQEASDSYINGYNASTPAEMTDAKNMYELQRQKLEKMLTAEAVDDIDRDPLGALDKLGDDASTNEAVIGYLNAKQVRDGMIQRVRDDIDGQIESSNAAIDARTHRTTAEIQPATLKVDDRRVYIVSGNLVQYADGSGVDKERSSGMLIVRDAVSGKLEPVSPDAIHKIEAPLNPVEEKAKAAEAIRQQIAQEAADRIDGVVAFAQGDIYSTADEQGGKHSIQVLQDNGDGTVAITVDDAQEPVVMAKEQLQAMVDAGNKARVAEFEAERVKAPAPVNAMPEYAINDRVRLRDADGNIVNGAIEEVDADGVLLAIDNQATGMWNTKQYRKEDFDSQIISIERDGKELWKEQVHTDKLPANGGQVEEMQSELKPVGKGVFGNIYNQFKGKAAAAVRFLFHNKAGEAKGVFHRDEIGDIGLIWGNKAQGLNHIIQKHIVTHSDFNSVSELLSTLEDVVSNGDITIQKGGNYRIEKDGKRAIIAKNADGDFVLTAYDATRSEGEKKRNDADATLFDQRITDEMNGALVSSDIVTGSKDTEKNAEKSLTLQYKTENYEVSERISQDNNGTVSVETGSTSRKIQDAAIRCQESRRAYEEACSGSGQVRAEHPWQEVEARDIEAYAKESGQWLDFVNDIPQLGEPGASGNENNTYISGDGKTIYKVNNLINSKDISSLLEKVVLHNKYFPNTAYELEGFTGFGRGNVYPVLKQKYVDGATFATAEEIDTYMRSLGFEPTGEFEYSNNEVKISDLRPRNVLKDADGDIYVVDAEFKAKDVDGRTSKVDGNRPQSALERIPKDEQGNPLYEQTDSDTAWDAIVEQTEGDESMAQTVADGMVADKEAALKKLEKAKPKGGATIAEKIAAEKERKAAIDAAQQELNIWKKIASVHSERNKVVQWAAEAEAKRAALEQERISVQEKAESESAPRNYAKAYDTWGTPMSFRDYLLRAISSRNMMFRWKDSKNGTGGLGNHLGLANSNEERRKRMWLIDEANGFYPEEAAEYALVDFRAQTGMSPNMDTSDALNEILDIFGSYDNAKSMWDEAKQSHERIESRDIAPQMSDEYEERYQWYMDNLHASPEDYEAYMEMILSDDIVLSEEDYNNLISEYIDGQGTIKAESYRSNQVLQGTQPVQDTGTGTIPTESPAVGERVNSEDGTASTYGGQDEVGRSLTADEAENFIADMEENADTAPDIELTIENWDALFGESGTINTPIGEVKMGENQFAKLMRQGREGKLGMIKPTLENPHAIVEEASEAKEGDTTERASSYIFIRSFKKADGSRFYYFTSITVSKDGREVVVSSQEKSRNKILRLLQEGSVIWRTPKDATTSSAERQGLDYEQPNEAETATKGSEITPQSTSSESKDTTNSPTTNELEEKNGREARHPTIGEQVQAAEAEVNTNPTEAQKEAGNYKKGHVQIGTFNVTIEQPKGSVRSGVDADGKKWETEMQNTYGYIRGTEGVDGDHIDVFLSDDIDGWDGHKVFVVDQCNADGSFDEHKVMLGFNDINDAEAAYMSNYEEGWQGLGAITGVAIEDFEKWIASSHRKTKAFGSYSIAQLKGAEYKTVKTTEGQSASADKDLRRKLADFNVGDVVRDYYNQKLYRIKKHSTNGVFTIAELDEEGNEVGTTTMNAHNNSRYSLAEAPVKAETPTISQESEQVSDQDSAPYTIAPAQYTTKKGKVLDMHLVKFADTLTKEQQRAAKELAKAEKGWYDREQGGFMMRSVESAKQLAETILNNEDAVSDAQPVSLADTRKVVESLDTQTKQGNRLVTDERYAELRERMRKKLGGQMNIGIDPEILAIGTEMAVYHLEKGARKFAEYATAMIADLGDAIRPYLKAFYNGARNLPEVDSSEIAADMTPYDEVQQFNIATFGKEHSDPFTTAEIVVAEQTHEQEAEQAKQDIINQRNTERRNERNQGNKAAIEAYKSAFSGTENMDIEVFNSPDELYEFAISAGESKEVAQEFAETYSNNNSTGFYDPKLNKTFIFAFNTDNPFATLFHEHTHYAIAQSGGVERFMPLVDELLELDPEMRRDISRRYRGKDVDEEMITYSLEYALYGGAIEELQAELSPESQRLLDNILNVIGYERGRNYREECARYERGKSSTGLANKQSRTRRRISRRGGRLAYREANGSRRGRSTVEGTRGKISSGVISQKNKDIKVTLQSGHGQGSLFDETHINNNEDGLQRTDAERSEGVSANGNRHEQGLSRGTETSSESEQQDSRRTDNGGERTGDAVDRTVRPRLSDTVTEQSIEGKRKKEVERNRKLANELKGVTLHLFDKLGGEREISGIVYYELANVFHCNDNVSGPFQATRKELDAILKVARKSDGKETFKPKNTRNNHSERGKDHAPTSVDARIEANIKAIELAKQLLESGEQATEKQMQTLRKFSGWGGLGKAFSEGTYYAPNNIAKKLRELLGERAHQEAVMSANSAYYTPAYVVDTLWDIAEKMGFEGGNILEGSAGIGNILGQMPTHISERSDIHAIEIDGTSGSILSLLYPDANVEIQGFEQTHIDNGTVDLAITNVPFVTGLRVNDTTGDKDLSKKFHNIHDFCIAKNVRKLREGGLGIFITSNGTLDNSKKLRDWIVSEGGADFVGAFRMHNKTFGGTGVTSDIIVIRKRVNGQKSANAIDVSTVTGERMAEYDTGETRKVKGKETPVIKQLSMDYNRYFVEHPENMAGEMHFAFEKGDTFRPTSKGLYPKQDKKQEQMLAEFVQSFTAEEFGERTTDDATGFAEAMQGKKLGELFVKDGKLYTYTLQGAKPLEVNANKVKGHTKVECFEAYTAIKEALAEVLAYQTSNESDEGLKPLLDSLNRAYDDFVATYGHFNKNTAIAFLRNDVDYASVFALERFEETADANGNKVQKFGKTDVFSKRVVEKEKEPTPTNVKDGIIASIFKFGRVDVPYIAEQLGVGIEDVKKEIIESGYGFENPATRQIEASYQYLSGNVREKLRQAEENNENGAFDRNIKALQEVMPMEIPAHLIDFTLGSSWIDPKLYEDYVKERTEVAVQFTAVGGTWFMKKPYFTNYEKNRAMGVTSEMLGRTIMGHTLIEAAIQNRSITVSTTKKRYDGSTETITDKEATQACAAKIDEIRQDFKEWARQKMQSDPEMSALIERIYNDTFNNFVPMSIPDEFVPEYFGGASHKFKMRPHQGKAIVRGTQQPLLLAHEVGTGKTFTLISTAMEMRRLGTARKPMIVVQNATVGQFVASAKELYPNAKILTLEEADRTAEGRKNFYAKIRYNDWDMIVVPQSTFEFIPDSEEREMAFVQDKIEEKMLILEKMKEEDPDGKSMITRQAEREIELLEEQLAGITDKASKKRTANDEKKRAVALQNAEVKAMEMLDRRTDDVENFDDMGIDALLVDEAHEYKHLGFATAMQRGVKGVDPSYSKKSQGVFLKTQAVLEKNNGRNVIFATGTPISNTAAEIWTFMRYLMPADTMKEYGIYYFDDFVRNFGNIQQMLEFTTSGKFKENNRFAGYVNLPELVRIWSGVSDTVLTKEAGGVSDKIPEMEGGKAQDLYLPQTRALRSIMKFVKGELEKYEQMSGKEKKENSHIPLTMYGIAKAAAVDARLVQADAEDDPHSKTNEAVRQTLRALNETADYKGTVAIFADNYQNKHSGFNIYDDIRDKLIAEGVPADEIVVMRSGMTVKKKLEIFEKVNRGEVRVILGSTFTLGTGVNIQERLHTLIHLDAPNRPMDYTQRNGRILRQGNLHKAMGKPVRILRFGVEDSLDVTAYQRLKTKGAIADSIMNGKQMMANSMTNRVLEEEEDVFGDTVAQLSGSEYAMLKNNAEKNVRKYASRKKQWEADQTYIHNAKPRVKAFIKDAEKRIDDNSRYLEAVRSSFPGGKFKEIVIGKHRFTAIDAMEDLATHNHLTLDRLRELNGTRSIDDFFKEHNKSLLAEMKQMKDGEIAGEQKRQLTIQIGDFAGVATSAALGKSRTSSDSHSLARCFSFVVTTKLTRQTVREGATLFNDVERKMTYSCAELGIEDIPVRQNLLRNAIEDITNNVITGKDFAERLEVAERVKKHNEAELEQLLSREGKPFEYEAELEQAKAQYEEYAELMKKELEQKEAKYAEMDATVESADNLSNVEEDELSREGEGTYTDDEVSFENDPWSKVYGKSIRTRKQRREFAERERQRMAERVENLAKKLHLDNVEIVTDASTLEGNRQRAKGFYSKSTGKITIVIPNHSSAFDVEQTLLHEAVAHYGLRQLFGEHFDTFLDNVFNNADEAIRQRIVALAAKNGWDFRKATEEYLAMLAENTEFENTSASWWRQIKDFFLNMLHKIGFEDFRGVTLTDNELRYILWRSYENLAEPGRYRSILGEAADVAKQYELGVGNYSADAESTSQVAEAYMYSEVDNQGNPIDEDGKLIVEQVSSIEEITDADFETPTRSIQLPSIPQKVDEAIGAKGKPIVIKKNVFEKNKKSHKDLTPKDSRAILINTLYTPDLYGQNQKITRPYNWILIHLADANTAVLVEVNEKKDNVEVVNWHYINDDAIERKKKQAIREGGLILTLESAAADTSNFLPSANKGNNNNSESQEDEGLLFRDGDPEMHERELARDRYERRVKTGMFQSQEALQDSMLGLKEAMQAILGQGTNIEDVDGFENAYLGENRLSSVNKAEADAFAQTLFKPMLDEVAKLARNEAERDELTDYMMAKHGLERNAYMRNEAINNGATDADQTDYAGLTALTGMDDVADAEAEAQRIVDDYEQAHDTTDLWEKVNAVSKAILQKSYDCGMMSKETFDKVSDMYEFYIPLRGFDEKTSAEAYAYLSHKHSAFNAPIKKAEGRRSKADDPFANLQSMAEGAIMQGNRNKLVKQRFLNFALNHPSDLVSVSDIWVEYDAVTDEWKPVFPDNIESTDTPEEVEQKMQDFETKMESLAQQHPDQYKRGKDAIGIPYRIVESRDMRQHQVVVKRGGRDYVITINGNPRAAQALNGQTNPDNDMSGAIGAILRAGEKINRQLSAFYTTRNPDFIVSNFMRDMLYTNSMAWIKESPNYALRFHRNYLMVNPVTMKRLLAKYRKGTLDMSNKTEAMFHQFMMNGGETGYANIRDIEQHKNDIRKELKRANGKLKPARAWSLLAEKFDELNRAVENCARFAAFITSREMGRSIDRAIYDAKEISVNFNKKGSGAKFYDSVGQTKAGNASALVSGLGRSGYVFWNAAIQGTTNFGRQMKRHPAKAFTGVAAMFLLGAIVAYLGGDDEDDKNAYYNLPEYVRRSNILFRAGDSWISIPLPIEYRAFYGMGELMTSVFSGKEHLTGGEIAEAVLGQATQILPIDFLEGGGGLNSFVPSAAKPLWEAYVAEKSWTGMPLYKDTPFNKDMPEWTKAYSSTNKHIVNLTAVLNEATGGDPYTKGAIDINPSKVEYMLNGYFGGVFGTIDKLTKTAETIVGDREYDPRSILLVNRLVKAGDERTEYRAVNNEYFRLKEEHDRLKTRLRHYEEDTDNGIFDYAEKIDFLYNSPEYERYEIFEDYRRDIDDLYDELQEAVDDEERKDIEAELNELKKEMIQEMNTTRKRK